MITFFTLPKPFVGPIQTIQQNAIRSWRALGIDVDILLLGNELGVAEMAAEVGARHLAQDCVRNSKGTPLLHWIFEQAQKTAVYPTVCYVNADILFTAALRSAVESIQFPRFFMVGRRTEILIQETVDFSSQDWEKKLLIKPAKLCGPEALDYFIFKKGTLPQVPPFALGRCFWDNWLVYAARKQGLPVIDATDYVTAFHQAHDYAHVKGGKRAIWTSLERDENLRLSGGGSSIYSVLNANYLMKTNGVIEFKKSYLDIFREVTIFVFSKEYLGFFPRALFNAWFQLKVEIGKLLANWRFLES